MQFSKLCVGLSLVMGASACGDSSEDPGWSSDGGTMGVTSMSGSDSQADDATSAGDSNSRRDQPRYGHKRRHQRQ